MSDINFHNNVVNVEKFSLIGEITFRDKGKGIQPFKENPPITREQINKGLCAHELFSLFTAEIIKRNIIFTR